MRMPPTKVDPRVRAACEVACEAVFVRAGDPAAEFLSVSSLAENVTRALRVAKEAMSDSNDVSVIARRELFLAVRGAHGAWRLGPGGVRSLVDDLETALLKSLAPEDPPTTPLLSSDRIQLSPAETYVKALEEAMFRGLGPQALPRIEYRPLSGEVHFDVGDPAGLERLERLDGVHPGLGALDRLMRDEWATRVDARKNGLAVSGTHEKGSAVTENKGTTA